MKLILGFLLELREPWFAYLFLLGGSSKWYQNMSSPFEKSVEEGCSVTQLCLTVCDPMNCSTPGFPVLHQLPGLAQTYIHWVSNTIQPSYPLSSPSFLAFSLSSFRVFSNKWVLCIRWPKYWSFSFNISPPMKIQGWFSLELTGLISLLSKELLWVFSTRIQKHQFFGPQPSLWSNSHICTSLLEKP